MNRTLKATKTCGNCMHGEWVLTPTGRLKNTAGQCKGVVTLVAPIAYQVTLHKHYIWPKTEAEKCPCHEFKAIK